jgi:hypothetical protein
VVTRRSSHPSDSQLNQPFAEGAVRRNRSFGLARTAANAEATVPESRAIDKSGQTTIMQTTIIQTTAKQTQPRRAGRDFGLAATASGPPGHIPCEI